MNYNPMLSFYGNNSITSANMISKEVLSALALKVHVKLTIEMQFKEIPIPNEKAEAKCFFYLSPNFYKEKKVCIFLQLEKELGPGLWSKDLVGLGGARVSMIPYFKVALQSGFGIVLMNPNTNTAIVKGHRVRILRSSTPEEHVMTVWENYIVPSHLTEINFITYDNGGTLVKHILLSLTPEMQSKINSIVFIESTHELNGSDPEWLSSFLSKKSVNFESSDKPMYSIISSEGKNIPNKLGCICLSAGNTMSSSSLPSSLLSMSSLSNTLNITGLENFGNMTLNRQGLMKCNTIQSVQTSVFVFLQTISQGITRAIDALKETKPNKLVVTVNRARLTGQPYNNPYCVIQCVGQKKETIGNHKHTMDPEWNQTFSFPVSEIESVLIVIVKDKTFPINTTLGQIIVPLSDIAQNCVERRWFTLRNGKLSLSEQSNNHNLINSLGTGTGEIELTLEWIHDTFVAKTDQFLRNCNAANINQNQTNGNGSVESKAESLRPPPPPIEITGNSCYLCGTTFLLHRKRYCKLCLRAICNNCSDRLFLPGFSDAKRVCTACCNLQIMMHKKGKEGIKNEKAVQEAIANMERMKAREAAVASAPLTIEDFNLLKVVGRGAFGKVLLVRKKDGKNKGCIYAMKILKKAHIIKNDQIENTKAEQHILKEIDHPFVVRLRYAFQNEEKLYLIMDYYPGGSMFYHLRKSKRFDEERTRLYMAQLLTAIMHLHSKQIAYRDLKLENILMDRNGNIALTDFGLSKENQTSQANVIEDGMKTICGTAEYMAPELLRHERYGKVVDWWSYGILLYEMLTGRTPFIDRNRRQMFKNIMTATVVYPPYISEIAKDLIQKLLERNPSKRLGSGPGGGKEIMEHLFFKAHIDFDKLLRKEVKPTFVPEVSGIDDITNVPQMFQNMEPIDSPVSRNGEPTHHFEGFTFQEESRLK